MGSRFEWIAIKEREVGMLPFFEGSDFLVQAQNLSWLNSAGGKRHFLGKTIGRGHRCFKVNNAGLRNISLVTGLKGKRNVGFVKLRCESESHIFKITIGAPHRGVNHDRNSGSLDFFEEQISLGGPIENEIEAKFFL